MGWLGGRRAEIRRLREKLLGSGAVAIKQADGSVLRFDADEVFRDTFTYFTDSLMADADLEPRPEPPAVLVAVANAVDRRAAYEQVMAGYNHIPVNPEALIEEGRFEPAPLVGGYETYEEF